MSLIIGVGVTKTYATDILKDINFTLEDADRVGLVGRNGEGKTTLLRILAQLDEATYGQIQRRRNLRIGYLPEDPPALTDQTLWSSMLAGFDDLHAIGNQMDELAKRLATESSNENLLKQFGSLQHEFESRGGYQSEVRIKTVLTGLGFEESEYHHKLCELSGGQRTRALLGRLLLEEPDVLLLDEPTNHLDLEAVEWLEKWLCAFPGGLLIVSHDRWFLDRVVKKIWEITFTRLEMYSGNYSAFVLQRAERMIVQQRTYANQQQVIEKNEEFIRRNFAAQKHKQAHSRQKLVDKLKQDLNVEAPRLAKDINLRFTPAQRSGELIFKTQNLVVGYEPSKPLLNLGDIRVGRQQRLALVGGNGVGKSTLVKTLLRQMPPLSGTVQQGASIVWGYLPQTHDSLDGKLTALQTIMQTDDTLSTERARTILGGFLFSSDDVYKRIEQLSGGERSRLVLATLAVKGANVLVLDEPTNHLDIASQEVLQEVLSNYEGTILFVSHDRYLINNLATDLWVIDTDGAVLSLHGNWQEFLRWRAKQAQRPAKIDATAQRKQFEVKKEQDRKGQAVQRDHSKKIAQLQRRSGQLESEIHKLEAHLKELSDVISAASVTEDFSRVHNLAFEYQTDDEKLKRLWAEWTEVAEKIDTLSKDSPAAQA